MENGYVAVDANGRVIGVATDLAALGFEGADVTDFGNRLLIPAMNDLHVHAPQYRNQALPWIWNCCRGSRTTRFQRR